MTLKQFKYLSEADQESILNSKAVHVASVMEDNERMELFQVESFYLEIQCFGTTLQVKTFNYFEETELLEPYLRFINIQELTHLI
jgi:hypothetical protein